MPLGKALPAQPAIYATSPLLLRQIRARAPVALRLALTLEVAFDHSLSRERVKITMTIAYSLLK